MKRNWLKSFTVLRESDALLCHVWAEGGSKCVGEYYGVRSISVPVRPGDGSSHRNVLDYVEAANRHLEEHHPKEWSMTDIQPNPNARRERLLRRAQSVHQMVSRLAEDLRDDGTEGKGAAMAAQGELAALCRRLEQPE